MRPLRPPAPSGAPPGARSRAHRGAPGRSSLVALAVALVATLLGFVPAGPSAAAGTLLSQGKTATASSAESATTSASAAVDGNTGTRWSSAFSDPQWIQVDLGQTATIDQVVLNWEAAYGKAFQIQVSADGTTWSSIYSTTTGTGGVQTLAVSGTGRYVRMYGTARGTAYGFSLWELQVFGAFASACSTTNAALNRPVTASSQENAGTAAANAVDANTGTRWASAFADPQWIRVDLGSSQTLCKVVLNWEAAYGKAFQIQVSPDGTTWSTIYSTTTGTGGVQTLNASGTGRYVRMYGTARGTGYGYSLWELAVHTTGGGSPEPPIAGGGDLGPNVTVFDPSMPAATIQAKLDEVFKVQEANQFGEQRNALLFKPGTYNGIYGNIGFYTHVLGLGTSPDDVQINGNMTVDAGWFQGNATQNFWRGIEGLSITPSGGWNRWAVSQAASFRRMHIRGGLQLYPNGYGWASGGYIADSKVDGTANSGSQQQWYTRDSALGSWTGSVWNTVFSGVQGAPPSTFPNPPITTLATTPVSREKPFLYVDGTGAYRVFVPALRTNASGPSWAAGTPAGTSLPLSAFYVAKPGDSAAKINQALAQGLHLLFTPGIYRISETIKVNRANTVVLGIGLPTIIPSGVNGMEVADVDGVKVAGVLFDAGTINSPTLLTIGPSGSTASHAANPTTVQDVYFRIGGAFAGKSTTSLVVNSNNTIIDHIWAWRGDHGAGIGWDVNTADTGLIVNGNDVLATGLFVEHYQKYEVIWNGERGRTIFFQNEMPYDPPNQAAWMNGTTKGYASYKVANNVTTHEAWGVGAYCYFNVDPTVEAARGFEVPNTPGVKFHNLLTVSLGGNGKILNIINTTGATAQGTATVPSYLTSYGG